MFHRVNRNPLHRSNRRDYRLKPGIGAPMTAPPTANTISGKIQRDPAISVDNFTRLITNLVAGPAVVGHTRKRNVISGSGVKIQASGDRDQKAGSQHRFCYRPGHQVHRVGPAAHRCTRTACKGRCCRRETGSEVGVLGEGNTEPFDQGFQRCASELLRRRRRSRGPERSGTA